MGLREGELLAALAAPAQRRLDLWARLRDAVDRAAEVQGPAREAHLATAVETLRTLRPLDRLWVYPGRDYLASFEQRLRSSGLPEAAAELRTTARLLGELGDEASLIDPDDPSYGARMHDGGRPHYFTVLLVDTLPDSELAALRRRLVELRREKSGDGVLVYQVLCVDNLEDALLAVTSNDQIQACVMALDFPVHGDADPLPLGPRIKALIDRATKDPQRRSWLLAQHLRQVRPQLDLYLVSDQSFVGAELFTSELWRRVFYGYESLHELHVTILDGVRDRYRTPFFDALRNYAARPVGNFHALPIARGHSVFSSPWLRDMADFYGADIFLAESSATTGGLDSLLAPSGSLKDAMALAARAFGARRTYFVTNGTSTANKIVEQALARPGSIILLDRNAHKSHHYGIVLGGAETLYLGAYDVREYAFYGGVPLVDIKRALLELRQRDQLDRVHAVVLTNCTMDGIVYDPLRVMQEVLAIKPDVAFLWDEAWYGYATFHSVLRRRTAMFAADALARRYRSPEYRAEYERWNARRPNGDLRAWIEQPLLPDPDRVRIRVYATQSTHKSLSAFRQGSMIHVYDEDFERLVAEPFGEAFNTHTSTSPNYQILASLDLARRQMELEGSARLQAMMQQTLRLREEAADDPAVSKWLRFLEPEDVIPRAYRPSGLARYGKPDADAPARFVQAWDEDEFVLDPTRMTLYTGAAGIDGDTFKGKVLMDRYGIQVNETSMNRVLMNCTIGVTWGSLSYLLDVLRREAQAIDRGFADASPEQRRLLDRAVARITTDLPPLPDFSEFHPAFRLTDGRAGSMREAFFLTYEPSNIAYVPLDRALERVRRGEVLVNAKFVVPYPPGFPVLVPGQILTSDAIEFLQKLSVKEVHGYRSQLGLAVFTPQALAATPPKRPPEPPRAEARAAC